MSLLQFIKKIRKIERPTLGKNWKEIRARRGVNGVKLGQLAEDGKPFGENIHTRQQVRGARRDSAWRQWRCKHDGHAFTRVGIRDDHGVMPRRTRRSIAFAQARKSA